MTVIAQTATSSADAILAVLKTNDGMIIDDNSRSRKPLKVTHVARFIENGKEHIVQVYPDTAFYINPITLDVNGVPHLRTQSFANIIHPEFGSLEVAIKEFNAASKTATWDAGTFTEVIAL